MAGVGRSVWDALADDGDGEEELLLLVRTDVSVAEATARTATALAVEATWPVGLVTPTAEGPVFDADVYELDERLSQVVAEPDRAGLPDARLEMFEPVYPETGLSPISATASSPATPTLPPGTASQSPPEQWSNPPGNCWDLS